MTVLFFGMCLVCECVFPINRQSHEHTRPKLFIGETFYQYGTNLFNSSFAFNSAWGIRKILRPCGIFPFENGISELWTELSVHRDRIFRCHTNYGLAERTEFSIPKSELSMKRSATPGKLCRLKLWHPHSN